MRHLVLDLQLPWYHWDTFGPRPPRAITDGHQRVTWYPAAVSIPGLRGRLKVTEDATTADRPRSVHFPEGLGFRNRESVAPPENDLDGLRRWPRFCR